MDGAIQRCSAVNLGIAVAIDEGLVAPVIPGADRLSPGEIARKRRALAEKARAGQLTLADLERLWANERVDVLVETTAEEIRDNELRL